ncbi:MAG: ATP-binding cassette domain-containing protein, partial [Aeoliella sp.]
MSKPSPKPAVFAPLLAAQKICKTYCKGANEVPVLKGVDLTVASGELVSIIGQSGSGKSTL